MASSIRGRPVHSNPQSLVASCQDWLQECRKNHPQCHRSASSSCLPSRLLDIGEERIRLLENPEGIAGSFATLTWCWGTAGSMISLRQEQLSNMVQEINFDELPRLFQDVVRIARGLGIRYLWIDALCTIQDDKADVQRELQKMPAYYANADFNIVAGVKDGQTKVLCPRLPPRFPPTRLNSMEDVFVGWLGTDAYNDPRGLGVPRYPDAWKYESPAHLRGWTAQEMALARCNLVFQGDENLPQDSETKSTMLTSQLYMQCQQEIRWENGRKRSETTKGSSEWYELIEEYSGRDLTYLEDRIPAFSQIAHRYSRAPGKDCGEFLAGLWSNDLLRGLLWQTNAGKKPGPSPLKYMAPSWSWAAVPGRVKHVWPRDATPLASVRKFKVTPMTSNLNQYVRVTDGYLMVRGLLVGFKPVGKSWSARTGDTQVNVLVENGFEDVLRIWYTFDYFDTETSLKTEIYGMRMTRRIGLLLVKSGQGNDSMKRLGLFIVAKADTLKWTALTGERDVKII